MAARLSNSSIRGSIWGHGLGHNETALVATDQAQYLTDEEISRFLDDLDHNGDGMIDYDEVEQKLDAVHDELVPQPREHNILARKRTQLMNRITRLHSRANSSSGGGRDKRESGNGSVFGQNLTVPGTVPAPIEENTLTTPDGAVLTTTSTRGTSITGTRRAGVISRVLSIPSRRMTPTHEGQSQNLSPSHFNFQRQRGHRHTHSQASSNTTNPHRHEFLRSIIGSDARRIPREEFAKRVREWNIPSLELSNRSSNLNRDYVRKMSLFRKIRAYWAVHGPEIAFLCLVIGLQLSFGIWQLVKYTREQYSEAFGWGIGMAKAFAGALYPTMFFLIISMSRYVSTFLRRSYWLSRFINWDLSQSFHVKISIVALVFSSLHTVGHLTGTFRIATEEERGDEVALLLGEAAPGGKLAYHHFVVSVPGITGIIALGLFYLLAVLSLPVVRRWNYEVFQLGHLLMYPIIGFLIAHGSAALLQYPMLGFWMAVPTVFVLVERLARLGMGFHDIRATVRVLDGETVEVTVVIPDHLHRLWVYKPGQYVFFQVPKISRFQWHPFTVSVCVGKKIQLLIKTDGNWTRKLRELADESGKPTQIVVGINGPFGAPAQRFYDYDHAIIVGSGIGVTPFSGILSDLQARNDALHAGSGSPLDEMSSWNGFGCSSESESVRLHPVDESEKGPDPNDRRRRQTEGNLYTEVAMRRGSTISGTANSNSNSKKPAPEYRRVDFHWTVRERNYLLWMSELLNSVFTSQQWHRQRKLDEQEQRRMSKQRQLHFSASGGMMHRPSMMPHLHLQRTMSSSKQLNLQRTLSSRSRPNSYIPPPNLPSTPSAAGLASSASSPTSPTSPRSPLSPTSPTSIPEEGPYTYPDPSSPSSPLSPISPFTRGFPRGTLSKPISMSQSMPSLQDQQLPITDPEDLDTLPNLDIRIHTHVTGILSKSRSIATHVYAWLLETHRTAEHPASPLTGLLNPTQFGRPDFVTILDNHYEDMVRLRARDMRKRELEREAKEQERQARIAEKERLVRERREREKEERERKRREREREREIRERAGVNFRQAYMYRRSNASFGGTFPRSGSGNRLSQYHRNSTWSGNAWNGNGNGSNRASAVSLLGGHGGFSNSRHSVLSGGITKSGDNHRASVISFSAGGGYGLGHAARRSRSGFNLFGPAVDRNLMDGSTYNLNLNLKRASASDMTLCSTGQGHVDSWYVYSSAAFANPAATGTTLASQGARGQAVGGSGADAGNSDGTEHGVNETDASACAAGPGESATTIVNDGISNSCTTLSVQAGPGPTLQIRPQPESRSSSDQEQQSQQLQHRDSMAEIIIEGAIAHAVHLEEAIPEEVYIGSSSSSSRSQASQASQKSRNQAQSSQGQDRRQPPPNLRQPTSQPSLTTLRGKPSLPALMTTTNANARTTGTGPAGANGTTTGTTTGLTSSRTLSVGGANLGNLSIGISTVLGNTSGSAPRDPPEILRIGVFYCGTPAVGSILADRCRALTARGHAEGTGIEYHFLTEVFG